MKFFLLFAITRLVFAYDISGQLKITWEFKEEKKTFYAQKNPTIVLVDAVLSGLKLNEKNIELHRVLNVPKIQYRQRIDANVSDKETVLKVYSPSQGGRVSDVATFSLNSVAKNQFNYEGDSNLLTNSLLPKVLRKLRQYKELELTTSDVDALVCQKPKSLTCDLTVSFTGKVIL